ncbi:MAG: ATP-binding protein [Methanosarcinales archaeon Met12]|nr:MAG: ATP-binding protein [Methanosarcinales archaeon Met12]
MNEKELQLVLEEGEGYKIEFKEALTDIDKELVAFANSSGGRIFLGITDDKEIRGVKITNRLKSQIQDIANNCQPSVKILFEVFKDILVIIVRGGEDKPYKCSSGFYTRVGPNSQKLNRDDIIEFFKVEGKIRFDELVNLKFDYDTHFDPTKLDRFLRLAGISKVLDIPSILINLGVAEKQEGKVIFNNAGILFFAKNLQDIYYHTAVTCALYKGTEKIEVLDRRDFNEDLISNIGGAMIFLMRYLAVRYEITGEPMRKEILEVPYEALREAIINAVAHRDYFEKGTNVMVEMFDDRIEITNFGGLVKGLKPEDFGTKSVLRNPSIADLLHRVKYIEKMGTGINKMRRLVAEAGLPPIVFEFGTFFTAIFRRPARIEPTIFDESGGVFGGVFGGVNEKVAERLGKVIKALYSEQVNISQLAVMTGISKRTLERDIALLKDKGFTEFEGAPKTGRYVLTEKGKKIMGALAT